MAPALQKGKPTQGLLALCNLQSNLLLGQDDKGLIEAEDTDIHKVQNHWVCTTVEGDFVTIKNAASGQWLCQHYGTLVEGVSDRESHSCHWEIVDLGHGIIGLRGRATKRVLEHYKGRSVVAYDEPIIERSRMWKCCTVGQGVSQANTDDSMEIDGPPDSPVCLSNQTSTASTDRSSQENAPVDADTPPMSPSKQFEPEDPVNLSRPSQLEEPEAEKDASRGNSEPILRVVEAINEARRSFTENSQQNLHVKCGKVMRPVGYLTKLREEEGVTKPYVAAVFLDPKTCMSSSKPIAEITDGCAFFGVHITSGKRTSNTIAHRVVIKTVIINSSTPPYCDFQRQRQVMAKIRQQGFRRQRSSFTTKLSKFCVNHPYEYFPQWDETRDKHNLYLFTDFAAYGSFIQFTQNRIQAINEQALREEEGQYDLFDRRLSRLSKVQTWQEEAFRLFGEIVQAVAYLHSTEACHLNLSPAFFSMEDGRNLLIAGFSGAEIMDEHGRVGRGRSLPSNGFFCAPEVQIHNANDDKTQGVNGRAVDMYALGILLYWLLLAFPPDNMINPLQWDPIQADRMWIQHLTDHVQNHPHSSAETSCAICCDGLPSRSLELFRGLMAQRPSDRISADEALRLHALALQH